MNKQISILWRSLMAAVMITFCASAAAAADTEITPEFAQEGVDKACAAMDKMVVKINELERAEDAMELQTIMNSIEFRNVRKKYGKVQLTDAYREQLLAANLRLAQAVLDYCDRAGLPFEARKMLEEHMTKERIQEELQKSTTLKEALS